MKKLEIFIFSSIFYISWIFINNFFENIFYSFIILLVVGLFFLVICLKLKKYKILFIFSILSFCIWIFVSKYYLSKVNENLDFLKNFSWNVEIVSEINYLKEIKDWEFIYNVKILEISWKKPKNKINSEFVSNNNFEKLKKWEIIKNTSKIYTYKNSSDFAYKNFMIANWYYFKQYSKNFQKIWENKINIIEEKIIFLREKLLAVIKELFPKNEAIFLGGILLWAREELPEELKQNFNNSWLTHFIAVSGFNITILIVFFTFFIKYLPKTLRLLTMSIIIFLFVLLVWFSAPVVRAWIMGFIGYLVLQNGRQGNILAISLLTLILMVTHNPFSINYDVSLHLSFLAVLWIIYTEKFFNKIFSFLPNFFEIRTAVSITFAALVFTLPIMIFGFWQLSIISPLTNLLVSWSIPLAMLFWFLSVIWYLIYPFLGIILWFFAFLLLKWNIFVVNFFWSKEFLVLKTDFWEYSWYFQLIYMIILWFIVLYFKPNKKEE